MSKLYQKINGSAVPLSGGVGVINNLNSTSIKDALSAAQGKVLADRNNYSTTEKVIGTWIDGKPIYRRKITGTTETPQADGSWSNHYINFDYNVDVFVKAYGSLIDDNGNTLSIPMAIPNNRILALYPNKANKNVNLVNTNVAWGGKTATIFIEYTKTTD